MLITSAQNTTFKWLKSLTVKKYRERENLAIFEGARIIDQLLSMNIKIKAMVISEAYRGSTASLKESIILTKNLFEQIADTVHSQGIIAVASTTFPKLDLHTCPHYVVCDAIQDPGNLGTILRTCDALGYFNVILTKGCVDLFSPKVLRATMGSLFNLNIERDAIRSDLIKRFKRKDITIVATALLDSMPLATFSAQKEMALIFGNEGYGVDEVFLRQADVKVHIPIVGTAESLNVAVSAGIVLSQLALHRL